MREAAFRQNYGADLNAAWDCIQGYLQLATAKSHPGPGPSLQGSVPGWEGAGPPNPHSDEMLIQQAWSHYLAVFKRINSAITQIMALDLPSCSPLLHTASDLDLGVPGTYTVEGKAVKIKSFHPTVGIIRSKQRPRKIKILGEDGQVFVFLLKVTNPACALLDTQPHAPINHRGMKICDKTSEPCSSSDWSMLSSSMTGDATPLHHLIGHN